MLKIKKTTKKEQKNPCIEFFFGRRSLISRAVNVFFHALQLEILPVKFSTILIDFMRYMLKYDANDQKKQTKKNNMR